jgi:hypothetical protein
MADAGGPYLSRVKRVCSAAVFGGAAGRGNECNLCCSGSTDCTQMPTEEMPGISIRPSI